MTLGPQFEVNGYTPYDQYLPSIAALPGGGFVVAWSSSGDPLGEIVGTRIVARRFDSAGAPIGDDLAVNQNGRFGPRAEARVTPAQDGGFFAVWRDTVPAGGTDTRDSIRGRRFASDGTPLASEVQVNFYTTGEQIRPDATTLADGSFVVAWESEGSAGDDQSSYSIQARIVTLPPPVFTDDFEAGNLDKWSESVGTPTRALDVGVDDRLTMKVDQRRVG